MSRGQRRAPDRGHLATEQVAAGLVEVVVDRVVLAGTREVGDIELVIAREIVVRAELRRHLGVGPETLEDVREEVNPRRELFENLHLATGPADLGGVPRQPAGMEEPHPVPGNGPADGVVELLHLLEGRGPRRRGKFVLAEEALDIVAVADLAPGVVAVPVDRLVGGSDRAVELVAAALGDDVDDETVAHRVGGGRSHRLDLGVGDRLGGQLDVGQLAVVVGARDLSLELHHVMEVLGSMSEEGHAAAAVVPVAGIHPGGQFDEVGPVLSRLDGDVALEVSVDGDHLTRLLHLDHGAFRRDRDGLFDVSESHLQVHPEVRAGPYLDVLTPERGETREFRRQRVHAGRQGGEAVVAFPVGHRRARAQHGIALGGHDDPGERQSFGVGDSPGKRPLSLGKGRGGRAQHDRARGEGAKNETHHLASPPFLCEVPWARRPGRPAADRPSR